MSAKWMIRATVVIALLGTVACGGRAPSTPEVKSYPPHENLLSIAAEFDLVSSLDPYREPPGKDLTGQSICHATLIRLRNYEALYPARFRPEILMLQGRALEMLGDFPHARESFEEAASFETVLREEAGRRSQELERLIVATTPPPTGAGIEAVLEYLAGEGQEYRSIGEGTKDPFYQSLAFREAESVEVQRAEIMAANRHLIPGGREQALQALEDVVRNHQDSQRATEHALRLARFHRQLAEEEVRLHPPELLGFDSEFFRIHFNAAADLLGRIAQADGKPEKPIARRELEALLAYGEYVSRRAQ